MERQIQETLFKTKYSELTDWICRERERPELGIKRWSPAQVTEQMIRKGFLAASGQHLENLISNRLRVTERLMRFKRRKELG